MSELLRIAGWRVERAPGGRRAGRARAPLSVDAGRASRLLEDQARQQRRREAWFLDGARLRGRARAAVRVERVGAPIDRSGGGR